MFDLSTLLSFLLMGLGARTLLWHLQSWQLREYRFDRMSSWLNTAEGRKSIFNLWFFKGLLPRPKLSGRTILIAILSIAIAFAIWLLCFAFLYGFYRSTWWEHGTGPTISLEPPLTALLIAERTLWLSVSIGTMISKIPATLARRQLFNKAQNITSNTGKGLTIIGITGSYGKSSTKEILIHLLQDKFGKDAVLYNPANENNEVAIARLIINNKSFFQQKTPRYFVCEMGAYSGGEIKMMCDFVQPHIGILTGLNQQHIELFGSFETIKKTKFELAEAATQKVFFNADNAYLQGLFDDRKINAQPIALSSRRALTNLKSTKTKTTFTLYDQNFVLPWPGEFFAQNALLALECAREMGLTPTELTAALKSLPPLKRALNLETHKDGYTIMHDTYSANPDGVLSAIDHLKNFKGQRILISLPLKELGDKSYEVHQRIFEKLKELSVETYWLQSDFTDLGQSILEDKFYLINAQDHAALKRLKRRIKKLKTSDVILLESKLPKTINHLFV